MAEGSGFTESREIVKPGAVLWEEGATVDAAYLIDEGTVTLARDGQVAGELGAGTMIGCAAVLLHREQPFTIKGQASVALLKRYAGHDLRHQFSLDERLARQVLAGIDAELAALKLLRALGEKDPVFRATQVRAILKARAEEVFAALA